MHLLTTCQGFNRITLIFFAPPSRASEKCSLSILEAMKKKSDLEKRYRELIFTFFYEAFLARTKKTRTSITTTLF